MSITDELREYANTRISPNKGMLTVIADRIDAAYRAAYQDGENAILAVLDKRGNSDVDKTMNEHGWYRALDADKKPIHLGDKVYQVKGGWVYTVKSISFYPDNTTVTFECEHGFGNDSAHNLRHYHEPTVEDMLWELLGKIAPEMEDEEAVPIVKAYAEKLQFADSGEEQ